MKLKNKILTKGCRILACHLLALSLLASCSQDDALPRSAGTNLPSLGLSTLQATDMPADETVTRAAGTTAYPTSKFIGFFVKADATNGYTACNNRKGEYNTTRKLWLPTPDSIWLNNHDADIAVYAPYNAAYTTAATLNLTAALRPSDSSKDIWCKRFTANNKSTGLAPVLEHVYSRFTISLSLDANYRGTAPVESVSLTNADLYATGTYKPFETISYTYAGDAGLGFKLPSVVNLTTAAPTGSIDLLLIPATLTGDIKLSLTVNGIAFGVTLSKASFGNKLQAGKQYNANIKLKPTALEVTSVTINDWNDETVSGDKEPIFIDPVPINIASLGFLVAPSNLRAVKLSDGSFAYEFAASQAWYSGIEAGGDYFNWNTLDPTNFSVQETVWSDNRDACRRVGEGWRTPTKAELQQVIDLPSYWGTWREVDGTVVNGRYFGIASEPAHDDRYKYVFLPASGERQGTGMAGLGTGGGYWTTTTDRLACGADLNGAYAPFYPVDQRYGFALRCVKDK